MEARRRITAVLVALGLIFSGAGLVVASAPAASAAGPAVVTLGFDDERVSQTNAFAGLQAQGFRGTFYVISQQINTGNDPESLTLATLKTFKAAGHEIGGHTRTHPDLTTLTQAQMTAEICGGRTDLINDGLGAPVSFAYPFGAFNATTEAVAKSCGFNNARTVADGPESIPPANAFATRAMPSIQAAAASGPAVTVAQMEGWVKAAEAAPTNKWVQLVWHDIVASAAQAQDEYYQLTPDFNAFLTWLKGEVNAGRVVVKTASQAMGTVPPPPGPTPFGAIGAKWTALGGAAGFLGRPLNNEYNVAGVAGARMEDFAGGIIYWSAATGAHEVHGGILAKYRAAGNAAKYGLPITDESRTPDGIGRYNHFTSGRSIYWTPATGAHLIYGAIRSKWASLGWERGRLGYPTTDEYSVTGGRRNDFQHGTITWIAANGAITVVYR